MTHPDQETISRYISGELPEDGRAGIEEHIYGCSECLEIYMEQLDAARDLLPGLAGGEALTDRIMDRLPAPRRWYHHPLFHYGIAAAIMLALMGSGLFHQLFRETEEWTTYEARTEGASYSGQLMEQTLTVIGHIKDKRGTGRE